MGWINKYIFLIIFLILITSLFSGCASLNSKKFLERETFRKEEKTGAKGWWYAKFRMDWPKDAEPLWHMDPLLAHRVIAPVLSRYSEEISLWRFHRRAAPDASGHQFSFIFYHPGGRLRRYRQNQQTQCGGYQRSQLVPAHPEILALFHHGSQSNVAGPD